MSWVLLTLAAWLVVSLPVALLVVRAIHLADREDIAPAPVRRGQPVLHLPRRDADHSPAPASGSARRPVVCEPRGTGRR